MRSFLQPFIPTERYTAREHHDCPICGSEIPNDAPPEVEFCSEGCEAMAKAIIENNGISGKGTATTFQDFARQVAEERREASDKPISEGTFDRIDFGLDEAGEPMLATSTSMKEKAISDRIDRLLESSQYAAAGTRTTPKSASAGRTASTVSSAIRRMTPSAVGARAAKSGFEKGKQIRHNILSGGRKRQSTAAGTRESKPAAAPKVSAPRTRSAPKQSSIGAPKSVAPVAREPKVRAPAPRSAPAPSPAPSAPSPAPRASAPKPPIDVDALLRRARQVTDEVAGRSPKPQAPAPAAPARTPAPTPPSIQDAAKTKVLDMKRLDPMLDELPRQVPTGGELKRPGDTLSPEDDFTLKHRGGWLPNPKGSPADPDRPEVPVKVIRSFPTTDRPGAYTREPRGTSNVPIPKEARAPLEGAWRRRRPPMPSTEKRPGLTFINPRTPEKNDASHTPPNHPMSQHSIDNLPHPPVPKAPGDMRGPTLKPNTHPQPPTAPQAEQPIDAVIGEIEQQIDPLRVMVRTFGDGQGGYYNQVSQHDLPQSALPNTARGQKAMQSQAPRQVSHFAATCQCEGDAPCTCPYRY